MPNSLNTKQQIVSHSRGQKRIDLRAALEASPITQENHNLTFGELARAYLATHYNGADMQMRKWLDLLGNRSAWSITAEELARAGLAMLENGYSPSTVNRNLSQIGSIYRWAKRKMLIPVGFISPTLSQHRYPEPIRRVSLSDSEIKRILDGASGFKDRRFAVLVRILIETGARRGEVCERQWSDIDLDSCCIEVLETKTGKPRMLFFSQETAALMRRVWPIRDPDALLFGSTRSPGSIVTFKKSWDKLTQAIGRPDLRLHDLRHYRAKLLIESGVTVAVAAQALGHSSLILHRRYGHLESGTISNAVRSSWK
ncbi:MAG: tyrosine-type recombinase/integrase [Polynucleobacter sp.]